jgi:hypothetical protein
MYDKQMYLNQTVEKIASGRLVAYIDATQQKCLYSGNVTCLHQSLSQNNMPAMTEWQKKFYAVIVSTNLRRNHATVSLQNSRLSSQLALLD